MLPVRPRVARTSGWTAGRAAALSVSSLLAPAPHPASPPPLSSTSPARCCRAAAAPATPPAAVGPSWRVWKPNAALSASSRAHAEASGCRVRLQPCVLQTRGVSKLSNPNPSVDDMLVVFTRSLLRSTGPLPVSKLSQMIGDEFLEKIGRDEGGLARFLMKHTESFCEVQIPGRVHVAMTLETLCTLRSHGDKTLAVRLIGLLTVAYHLPGTPVVKSLGLTSPNPSIPELCKALRHWALVSQTQLTRFLRQYDDVFQFQPITQNVRMRALKPFGSVPAIRPDLPLTVEARKAEATRGRLQLWLGTAVPSQYHVPMSYVMELATASRLSLDLFERDVPTLEDVRRAFQRLPAQYVDVRAFANAPAAVFVRLLRPEQLLIQFGVPTYSAESPPPEASTTRYDPTHLGRKLTAALQARAGANTHDRLRLQKGLNMADLRDLVPAALIDEIEAFYGLAKGGDLRVSVLLLDRMRHLWEVHLDKAQVRPWAFLPQSEQPSSLILETSPIPRVMLHLQHYLKQGGPQTTAELFRLLSPDLQQVLCTVYAPIKPDGDGTTPSPNEASGAAAVGEFTSTHSLFFTPQNGRLFTPMIAAEGMLRSDGTVMKPHEVQEATKNGAQPFRPRARDEERSAWDFTELELAKFMYEALPPGQPVNVDALRTVVYAETHRRGLPVTRGLRFVRREFFERHPNFFRLYSYFAFDKLVVGRVEDPPPPPHVLQPDLDGLMVLLKFMALLSTRSITDGALTRSMPPNVRHFLKRFGSVTDIAEQLPMWFSVQRDKSNFGSSLIRYIGPVAETPKPTKWAVKPHPKGVLRRKVPNDPFLEFEPFSVDDTPEGWNAEWNEDDDDAAPGVVTGSTVAEVAAAAPAATTGAAADAPAKW